MSSITRLNSKEKKQFVQQLQEQYGYTGSLDQDVLINKNKGKYYLVSPELLEFDFDNHRIESIGLYFATSVPPGVLRLTIDGAQIIGPYADSQVYDLDDEQTKEWIRGHDLEIADDINGWLILRHKSSKGTDYLGCGKVVHKEENICIHNYIPKTRYVRSAIE